MKRALNRDSWFTIRQLADSLYGIGEFGHFEEVLSFLLIAQDQAVLIDSGLGLYSMKEVVSRITDLPCSVLNTHSHFDHVGSNAEFSSCSLFDHPDTRRAAAEGFSEGFLERWAQPEQFWGVAPVGTRSPYQIDPFPAALFFTDGQRLDYPELTLEVLHTPGHSDDSVCFYEPRRGWLFAGDLIYDGPIFIESDGGLKKYRNSLTRIAELKDLQRIFCSHNGFEISLLQFKQLYLTLQSFDHKELCQEIPVEGRMRLVPEH